MYNGGGGINQTKSSIVDKSRQPSEYDEVTKGVKPGYSLVAALGDLLPAGELKDSQIQQEGVDRRGYLAALMLVEKIFYAHPMRFARDVERRSNGLGDINLT
ncbi:hypothetical protein AB1N83_009519 [Pleurotus pulmonarius]